MLRVDQVHVVRHKVLVEGRSQRAVARELGMSRVTVRKYLDAGGAGAPGGAAAAAAGVGGGGPAGRGAARRVAAVDRRQAAADGHAAASAAAGRGPRGRRHAGARRRWRSGSGSGARSSIPLTYRPGDLAEVDFFEVLVDVAGERRKAWLFLLRLMYSGRDFGWIYERQDQVSFLDGHVRAFAHLGGVPGAHGLRQSAAGGDADPGRRRADADAALRGARVALSARAVLLSARRGP